MTRARSIGRPAAWAAGAALAMSAGACALDASLWDPYLEPCYGYSITIQENTVLRLGVDEDIRTYTVGGARVTGGKKRAILTGSVREGQRGGIRSTTLYIGDSVTDDVTGKFTLEDVTEPSTVNEERFSSHPVAYFCYEPNPSFRLNPEEFPNQPSK